MERNSGRDGTRRLIQHVPANLALTPTLSHPQRAGEGESGTGHARDRVWPVGRDTLFQ